MKAAAALTLVGVGPGDPNLLTVAAVQAIAKAAVVAYPVAQPGAEGMAARITQEALRINMDPELVTRALNVDLSGGEKKRNETMQLGVLEPKFAILDELDSGLDIDALRDCARRVEAATHESNLGVLAITHYVRLFEELKPDVVHIMVSGRIVASGGAELADQLEIDGYAAFV